jgi:hypothetical protein
MFHLSRSIAFIACLAAAIFVAWWVGLLALAAAVAVIPRSHYSVRGAK